MIHANTQHTRILAIAPSTRGFGFAVFEGDKNLVDWGVKSVDGDKNKESVEKVKALIARYQPEVIVLEDTSAKGSRRAPRIKRLTKTIVALASSSKIKGVLFSQTKISTVFFGESKGTKHARAEIITKQFPEELGFRLPPKRKPWMSEDSRMDIFDAVSLVLVFHQCNVQMVQQKSH